MIRIISALILAMAAALCNAAEQPLQLADNAPGRHIVVPGDTLWGIAGKFLKEPWRWPEVWQMNREQVKNPHRIFPGDVIVLDRDANGNLRLRMQSAKLQPQIYSEQISQAIPSIPPNVINPFLSAPLIVEVDGLDRAARIVATQEDRVFLGNGDTAYVANAEPGEEKWQIYRKGRAMPDPDTKEVLGYEAYYLGTARQVEPGDPATFVVSTAKEEIGRGDRLLPATPPQLFNYVPHKPDQAIDGRVIAVYGGVNEAGKFSIISLNRGTSNGIEVGHVLTLERNRVVVQRDDEGRKETVKLPEERYGLLFVFRTFERISYALVMQSDGPVKTNDFTRTP
jgi:nucleoid-associated protein YgaU